MQLGSASVKAVHKTLMKLSSGVIFIKVLRAALTRAEPESIKRLSSKYVGEIEPWWLNLKRLH
jgi:hypothetical protein